MRGGGDALHIIEKKLVIYFAANTKRMPCFTVVQSIASFKGPAAYIILFCQAALASRSLLEFHTGLEGGESGAGAVQALPSRGIAAMASSIKSLHKQARLETVGLERDRYVLTLGSCDSENLDDIRCTRSLCRHLSHGVRPCSHPNENLYIMRGPAHGNLLWSCPG